MSCVKHLTSYLDMATISSRTSPRLNFPDARHVLGDGNIIACKRSSESKNWKYCSDENDNRK